MNRNLRFVVGAMVIVATIAYLMYTGIRETSAYYLTIQEFLPKRDQYGDMPLRVAGRVQAGSIDYDAKYASAAVPSRGVRRLGRPERRCRVTFTGIKPDMFADGRDVIVEGRYTGGVLEASQVLTSCPSKYEARRRPKPANGPGPPGQEAGMMNAPWVATPAPAAQTPS